MKKLNLFFFLVATVVTFQVYAQNPYKVWDKTIGGSGQDWDGTRKGNSIVAANDGGYVIVGYSNSGISGDKSEESKGAYDYWVVKLNSAGQKIWDRSIGGSGDDGALSIVATTDGGFVIAGTSGSGASGDKSETYISGSGFAYWIVKLNSVGQIVWENSIGGANGTNVAYSIVAANDGGFVIAGSSNCDAGADKTEQRIGLYDYWIVKINSSGQVEWDNTLGGNLTDTPYSITAVNDGGFVIAGSSSSVGGDKTEGPRGNGSLDYWIIKLNSAGVKVWDKTIGSILDDTPFSIAATNDGGCIVAGRSGYGQASLPTADKTGLGSGWIVKLNSLGQIVWQKSLLSNNSEIATSIVATTDGNFVVAGYTTAGVMADKTEASNGGYDYWMLKLNYLGEQVWDKAIGGSGDDITRTIIANNDGSFIISGYSNSGISGDKSELNRGGYDYWIVKIQPFGPCPNTLTPTGTVIINQKAATTVITVAGTLNTIPNAANVTYQAGNYVQLNAGFVANSGAVFTAKILANCQ